MGKPLEPLERPSDRLQPQYRDRTRKSFHLLKTSAIQFAQFIRQPSMKMAAGAIAVMSTAIPGLTLYQQHQTQQTEQAILDRSRQLKPFRRYQDCLNEAERFSPNSPPTQGLAECSSTRYQDWLAQGQALANQGKWKDAIAQLQRIPHSDKRDPAVQQVTNQIVQQILNAANQQYQNGDLEQAIALVQMTPSSSSLYQDGQERIKQWVKNWNQDKNHFANAEKAKTGSKLVQVLKEGEQIKHPYWKQKVAPLVAETKVALKRLENERKPAFSAITPPGLTHSPVYTPPDEGSLPDNQPVSDSANFAPARSLPPAPPPATANLPSADVERF